MNSLGATCLVAHMISILYYCRLNIKCQGDTTTTVQGPTGSVTVEPAGDPGKSSSDEICLRNSVFYNVQSQTTIIIRSGRSETLWTLDIDVEV